MPNRRDPQTAGRGEGSGADARGVPAGLDDLSWELAHTFLGLEGAATTFERAGAVVLPVPYEATTSWGGGTRGGPRAILEASRYVELYDRELDREIAPEVGIHTLPALELSRAGPAAAMEELASAYARVAEACGERFLVMLGGEHSVSGPAILAQADRHPDGLTVLQLDAHTDLRPEYEGTPHSHASAIARVLDRASVVAVGVRGVSAEEVAVARDSGRVELVWAEDVHAGDAWMDRALAALGPRVYLTFDVDYFDPSLVPSTGTPEPGGGDWYRTLAFLRRVFAEREVVAADVVELAPTPGLPAPDFLVAKLVYKLISYRFEGRGA